MSFNDPIAEMLSNINNSLGAKHRYVDIHLSKVKLAIVKILKEEGFIENFLVDEKKKLMRLFLRYTKSRHSVIRGLKRVSTPGLRKYVQKDKLPRVCNNFGTAIVSTSKGIIKSEKARELNVGGEVMCYIW